MCRLSIGRGPIRPFADLVGDDFLMKVRKSYTSYLKLFDPTLVSTRRRIIIVDTDVLFLRRPSEVIDWAVQDGGTPWYHKSEPWKKGGEKPKQDATHQTSATEAVQPVHIQQLVVQSIPEINKMLNETYAFVPGFNSGFIGYERGTVDYAKLKRLLTHLYDLFGDRIFRWGAEQTMHGLVLCGRGAKALSSDEYMVHTNLSSDRIEQALFVHFIGEYRYHRLKYPRMAARVIAAIKRNS